MPQRIVIGTRASRLALAQTHAVAARLREAWPDVAIDVEEITTAGDRDRRTPLAEAARSGGVGFFTKELERALADGRIDLAVHSLKDVPTRLAPEMEVEAAVPPREDPWDCLVTVEGTPLESLAPGSVVGTSSPRRRAMLLAARPDLGMVELRGNVDTRLRRLDEGRCDATVLAAAGLARLSLADGRAVPIDPDVVTPAAGQGALGLEFRSDDERLRRLVAPLDDPPSRQAVVAERACVRRLGAGCSTPLGVLARVDEAGRLEAWAMLVAPDGRRAIRRRLAGPAEAARDVGRALAEALLAAGAGELLAEVGEEGAEGG